MDKKEIYEHLAKIYLDASQKKNKKVRGHPDFMNFFIFGLLFIVSFGIFSLITYQKNKSLNATFALVLQPDIAKINFNFDPARKEIYSVNLNKLNLSRFKALGFSVKKANFSDTITIRVEFTNTFKEKSAVYVRNIPHKWQSYKISFLDFKHIRDWSQMENISFIIEEWNTKEKNGVVYIDNVGFLR